MTSREYRYIRFKRISKGLLRALRSSHETMCGFGVSLNRAANAFNNLVVAMSTFTKSINHE